MSGKSFTYIDLFSGAGGLSEGFFSQGDFSPIAHVEMNKDASDTLRTRHAYHYLNKNGNLDLYYSYLKNEIQQSQLYNSVPQAVLDSVINYEISKNNLDIIFEKINILIKENEINEVDLIIGGPPCQGFSLIGRSAKANKNHEDPRNFLYLYYVEFLKRYSPKMFIFENVPGILSHNNEINFKLIISALSEAGYTVDYKILNAKDFSVLQNRKRVFIIGWRKDFEYKYPKFEMRAPSIKSIKELFSDLPLISAGGNSDKYLNKGTKKMFELGIRNDNDVLTWHEARYNNERDLNIYKHVISTWNKYNKRILYNQLPKDLINHKNTTSFLDRFKIVADNLPYSHTITAHISKDGHYYIHPDISQLRSLSVREAARIQSFPDSYFFEGSRTSVLTQIGNAVPPMMAKCIAHQLSLDLERHFSKQTELKGSDNYE